MTAIPTATTAMYRVKQLFGGRLSLRTALFLNSECALFALHKTGLSSFYPYLTHHAVRDEMPKSRATKIKSSDSFF